MQNINIETLNDILIGNSMNGNINIVKEAIANGADIHAKDDSAFKSSAVKGHLDIVSLLLQLSNNSFITPSNQHIMRMVLHNGHTEMFKYLIEKGFDIHFDDDQSFVDACKFGNLEIVKYLINKGANIHSQDNAALTSSVGLGKLEIVKYLAQTVINIHDYKDEMLVNACRNNRFEMVEYLIDNGADIKTQDHKPLLSSLNFDIIKALLKAGEDIHLNNEEVLIKIVYNGKIDQIKYLIKNYNCNIHAQDDQILKTTFKHIKSTSKELQKKKKELIEIAKFLIDINRDNILLDKIIDEHACEYMRKYYSSIKLSEILDKQLNTQLTQNQPKCSKL